MPKAMLAEQKAKLIVKVKPHRTTSIRASVPSSLLPPDIKQRSVFPGEKPLAGIPAEYHEGLGMIFNKITPGEDGISHVVISRAGDCRTFVDFFPAYGLGSMARLVRAIEKMIADSDIFQPEIDTQLLTGSFST